VRILDTIRTPQVANGSYIRPPVCVSTDDHIVLNLEGTPPFQVNYDIKRGKERPDRQSFTSLQTEHRVQLQTSQPGRVVYEVTAVGDAKYSVKDEHVHSSKDHPRWEQQVLGRPAAYFKTAARLSYCLNDALVPRPESHLSQDGVVVFEGKVPFIVSFSIHNLASSETRQETKEFNTHEWHLDFPEYTFSTVGSYLIAIDSVRDASSCEEIIDETAQRSIWADVAETAMIVPFERRTDVCVGDLLQFQLEGMAPWTITYRFNNKVQKTIQKTPKYTTVANVAGEFSVISIAHQQAQCQTSVSDVRLMIHEIPSAQVSHGSRFEENIREGKTSSSSLSMMALTPIF
jgi:nucleoporin POM152